MNKKIFLVEDDLFLGKLSRKKFELAGLNVQFFDDGLEVASQVKKENPAVIVLDLVMPKKNGFQVLEELKEEISAGKVLIIIVSALSSEEDKQRVAALGVKKYFVKSETQLSEIIEYLKKAIS